jgi:SAM-dependent methyltransferase
LVGVEVFVKATTEDFDARCYLLANPDVATAGHDPTRHFRDYGLRESRMQINPQLIGQTGYRTQKFQRFRSKLTFPIGQETHNFPIFSGSGHFHIDQYLGESANSDFPPFTAAVQENPGKLYMDLGCGLRRQVFHNCLYVEVYPSIAADLIVDPTCIYPIESGTFDGIGCFAVLEHTREPWTVVHEMYRMLKPGGTVWIDWPFLQPVHGFPSHFYNATREGLRALFEDTGFTVKSCGTLGFQTPDYTITWILNGLLRYLSEGTRQKVMNMTVRDLLAQQPESAFWRELLTEIDDLALSEFACGNTLVATKD